MATKVLTVRLDEGLKTRFAEHCEEAGRTPSEVIRDAIRGALARGAQFGANEREALGVSNERLMLLVRALEDIAERMPAAALPEHVTPAALGRIAERLEAHTDAVDRVLRAAREGWSLVPESE